MHALTHNLRLSEQKDFCGSIKASTALSHTRSHRGSDMSSVLLAVGSRLGESFGNSFLGRVSSRTVGDEQMMSRTSKGTLNEEEDFSQNVDWVRCPPARDAHRNVAGGRARHPSRDAAARARRWWPTG